VFRGSSHHIDVFVISIELLKACTRSERAWDFLAVYLVVVVLYESIRCSESRLKLLSLALLSWDG
jgi:hypothetical protein